MHRQTGRHGRRVTVIGACSAAGAGATLSDTLAPPFVAQMLLMFATPITDFVWQELCSGYGRLEIHASVEQGGRRGKPVTTLMSLPRASIAAAPALGASTRSLR
jgi:hypothetical protein